MIKNINKPALFISLGVLLVAFSLLAMMSVPAEMRYTWFGMNPWYGFEGIANMVNRFLSTGPETATTWIIASAITFLLWWRLYAVFYRIFNK